MNDSFEKIAVLAQQFKGLANDALPIYKAFSEDVLCERLTDIQEIERNLDGMVSFCFDDRILLLYKKVLRKLYDQHPETVKSYVDIYYDMFEENGEGDE